MDKYYRKRKEKEQLKRKLKVGIPIALLIVALIAGILHFADQARVSGAGMAEDNPDTVKWGGKTYVHKNNVQSYLFIGDDAREQAEDSEELQSLGLCDTLILLVVDQNDKSYSMLPINRNTITNINNYDENGEVYGVSEDIQICYAHAAAYREEDACKNTVDAVSELLKGQRIDGFYSLNMNGIATVNDLVDGVTVSVDEDMTRIDPALKAGSTVKLTGEQAEKFVRARRDMVDDDNAKRIKRQNLYLEGVKSAFKAKYGENADASSTFMDALSEYAYTDITGGDINKIANALLNYEAKGNIEITGQKGNDDFGWGTFAPDQDSLTDAIITLFYKEK